MSLVPNHAQMDIYCRDYFDSPIHLLTQTKPDEWARSYLKSWLDQNLDAASDEMLLQACHQVLKQHNQSSWIQRLWQRLFSPIGQLKTFHAMSVLRQSLNQLDVQTPQDLTRIEVAFINARMHREFWFWINCCIRWLIGASNPWTTKGLSTMNEKNEQNEHLPTVTSIFQERDARHIILNILHATQSKLTTYGTRMGKKNFLVGEPFGNKMDCANKLGLISRDACLQARNRISHRDYFQTITKHNKDRILFEDTLTYYRALEEEIKACQLILTNDLIDPTAALAALESLLTLIQEGFYVNQYIYSTHHLSANEPLGCIWEIYNALPQQLQTNLQTCLEDTPDWLTTWVAQVQVLASHMQLLTDKSRTYNTIHGNYIQINETIQKRHADLMPPSWPAMMASFSSLEQKRQIAYHIDRLNLDKLLLFFNELESFGRLFQSFVDDEWTAKDNNTSNTSYMSQAVFSLYHQSAMALNDVFRAVYPSISSDNPYLTQMEKEIQAYHRVQIEQQKLNQAWDATLHYKYTREDYGLLKEQLNSLKAQLTELGQQQAMITPLMQAWRPGDDITAIAEQMAIWISLRRTLEQDQGCYQTNFDDTRLVPIDSRINPLIEEDLNVLNLTTEHPITKKQLNQQYKKLSLAYHPDKHRSDTMPKCNFLWLDTLTKKEDILNYYAHVNPANMAYIFAEKTGELFYADAENYQIESIGVYNRSLFAELTANSCVNIPSLLTEQQIEWINQQTNHNHRAQFWQIKTNCLQTAYKRLLISEQGLDVVEWEKSNAEVYEKLRREINQLREEQIETKAVITEQLATSKERLDVEIERVFSKLEQQNAEKIAQFNEQHVLEISNLKAEQKQLSSRMDELDDLIARASKQLNELPQKDAKPCVFNPTQSNTEESNSPDLFG